MAAYRNGIKQQLTRNGVPQDAWLNGVKVSEVKKRWYFTNSTNNTFFTVNNLDELKTSNLRRVTAGGIMSGTAVTFKGKIVLYSSNLIRYCDENGGNYKAIDIYPFSNSTSTAVLIYGIKTNPYTGALYLFVRKNSNTKGVILKTFDLENFSILEEYEHRPALFLSVPMLGGIVAITDSGSTGLFVSFKDESITRFNIGNSVFSGFLSRDSSRAIAGTTFYGDISKGLINNRVNMPSTVAENASLIIGECKYQDMNCIVGIGISTHPNPDIRSSLTFFEDQTFSIVRQWKNVSSLSGITGAWSGSSGNCVKRSPNEFIFLRSNAYPYNPCLIVPYENPENWTDRITTTLGYNTAPSYLSYNE